MEIDKILAQLDLELKSIAEEQIGQFLRAERRAFTAPIEPKSLLAKIECSDFMRAVLEVICEIPYGQTRSYSQLATAIGRPKAARAVGRACHCNPLPILIPCHRVLGADGSLVGYALGLDYKKQLLELESSNS